MKARKRLYVDVVEETIVNYVILIAWSEASPSGYKPRRQ
jgi:hypothetical protein